MRALPGLMAFMLIAAWAALLLITVHAVRVLGAQASSAYFFGDFANPWRAQFNGDFAAHLLIFAAWIFWRTESKGLGLLLACLSAFFGGIFNLLFLFFALVRAKGNMHLLLLGFRTRSAH